MAVGLGEPAERADGAAVRCGQDVDLVGFARLAERHGAGAVAPGAAEPAAADPGDREVASRIAAARQVHRGVGHQVAAGMRPHHGVRVLEQAAEADRTPGAGKAKLAEAKGQRLDRVRLQQHEQLARLMAGDEHVGAAPATQQATQRERAVGIVGDLAELQDLGLAIGLEQQRRVGAVEHRLLGRALQPVRTGGHEHGERVLFVGGEGRARSAERVDRSTPGCLGEGAADQAPAGALGRAVEHGPGPARGTVPGHEAVEPRADAAGVVDVAQERQVGQDQPCCRGASDDLDQPAGTGDAVDGSDVARRFLRDRLHGNREVGADLDPAEADAEGGAAREDDLDHVGGLEAEVVAAAAAPRTRSARARR